MGQLTDDERRRLAAIGATATGLLAKLVVDGDLDEVEWLILDELVVEVEEVRSGFPYFPHL